MILEPAEWIKHQLITKWNNIVEAKFLKNVPSHVHHWRNVRFNLLKEEETIELLPGGIIVGSCEEDIKQMK